MLKVVLLFALILGFLAWKIYQNDNEPNTTSNPSTNPSTENPGNNSANIEPALYEKHGSFIMVGPGRDIPEDTVVIIGASCNVRANNLSKELDAKGIPNVIHNSFMLALNPGDDGFMEAAKRMEKVFDKGSPVVFINQMASSNPTTDAIVTEYKRQTKQ